ncbi:ZIP family metal transporter [Candidatus Parcubacteria bacterium]|nr:ZIP family metal transporter [Candidatus Parcubacteria bacterium]
MALVFILLTFVSTFAGGLFALRFRHRMHLILGFTAGVLLAVVAFDIFPEIILLTGQLSVPPLAPMIALVLSFLLFHIVEKFLLIHHSHEAETYGPHKHPTVGVLSASALIGHSFLDGVGIGLGFQISGSVGIMIAIAVIAHDFSDGLNTVSLMLAHKNTERRALWFLFFDALAPVIGGLSTLFFAVPQNILLLYLGFFAGFLLYIGASDILPEAHSQDSSWRTVLATVLGVLFIYFVLQAL